VAKSGFKIPFYKSVKFKFAMAYIVVILGILTVLNIYPIFMSEDLTFRAKESAMTSQVSVLATSLSGLESLDRENVGRVMDLIDTGDVTRCLVSDSTGLVLYDSQKSLSAERHYALFGQMVTALEGYDVFSSEFADEAIHSSIAMPVTFAGRVIGAVYLYEYDEVQAGLLLDFQSTIRTISLIAAAAIVVISLLIASGITRRISGILAGVRVIRSGGYSYRMHIRGSDEIAQLGREFNNMTDTLETTENMRRRFVSDASHELKTPLASIRLLTDSILQTEEMDPAVTREFVSDIGHEADRLGRMTEKLLKITRLDASADESWGLVDMSRVTETVCHMLQPLADTGDITLETRLAPGCFMRGVDDDFYQVVFNLTENALKYNVPEGRVLVTLFRDGADNVLTVDDTGIGIPEADAPKIFERFYRVDKARSRETGGSGLGLSIVHDTVEKYGGTVTVGTSKLGGTCFTVRLPAEEAEV